MKGEQQVPWGRETWRIDEGQELYDTVCCEDKDRRSYWKTKGWKWEKRTVTG